MSDYPRPTGTSALSQWDAYAERLRVQLPAAPDGLLNGYVRWAPWVAIVFGIIGFLATLALLGLGAILSPFLLLAGAQGVQAGGELFLSLVLGLVLAAAEVVGGFLMRDMRLTGWWILALGLAVNLLTSLFHFSALGLIVTLLVAYIHVMVKPRYS